MPTMFYHVLPDSPLQHTVAIQQHVACPACKTDIVALGLDVACQTFGPPEKIKIIERADSDCADTFDGIQRAEKDPAKRRERRLRVARIWHSFIHGLRHGSSDSSEVAA
jgi:hypothetical protein